MAKARGGFPLGQLWGPIQRSVSLRETTAQLWARLRTALQLPESGPTGLTINQVNQIRADAASIRRAGDSFGDLLATERRTGLPQTISARELSTAPWSRPVGERQAAQRFQVNFQMTLVDDQGNTETEWFTTYVRGLLPGTAGEVADLVQGDAEMMSLGYGKTLGGIGDIQVIYI